MVSLTERPYGLGRVRANGFPFVPYARRCRGRETIGQQTYCMYTNIFIKRTRRLDESQNCVWRVGTW